MKINRLIFAIFVASFSIAIAADREPAYLTQHEIDGTVSRIADLEYPMTQSEAMTKLGIVSRHLPGMVALDRALKSPGPQYYLIHLTEPDVGSREYLLYLWFDQNPQKLSGEAFASARNIEYAEILFSENGGKDKYVVQSSRYPYVRLSYAERKIRKD